MRDLSLKMKLALGFGLILALLATTGGFSYYATLHLVSEAQDVDNDLKQKDPIFTIASALPEPPWAGTGG